MLASVWWYRGRHDRLEECLARAVRTVEDRPSSPAKAFVLSAVARFRMLSDDFDEAIASAHEAVRLAEAFGLHELRADALITLGTAKWNDRGDPGGVTDVEVGLGIALELNALSAALRGYNNLASMAGDEGDFRRRRRSLKEALRIARQLGARDAARFVEQQLISGAIHEGAWDDALRAADEFIAECEAGSPHRGEQRVRTLRAKIYFARDEVDAARADCERAVALAHDYDPHQLADALAELVEAYGLGGDFDEARRLAEQILAVPATVQVEVVSLAWFADRLGLDKRQLESRVDDLPERGRVWRELAQAMLAGSWEDVAESAVGVGIKELEADARLRAAEALLANGRIEQARDQVHQALAFFRSVRATRFIREAEALLAEAVPTS
jgi:tetratricopeptide (TPR) repeat protein